MDSNITTTPAVLQSACFAPTSAASWAGVCPQDGIRRADAHTQVSYLALGDAGMTTGYRSWSPLIT